MSPRSSARNLERQLLQTLCQGTPGSSVRAMAKEALKNYRWREPTHQAVFNAVMRLARDDPQFIREQLPGQLTRMGFPDVDLQELFRPHSTARKDAEDLISRLAATAGQR